MKFNKHTVIGLAATWFGAQAYAMGWWFGAFLLVFGLFELWQSTHDNGQPPLPGA